MTRSRSVASQEVTLYLPQEAIRQYKGTRPRQGETDALGNGPVEAPLARTVITELARLQGIEGAFSVTGDGHLMEGE